MENISRTKSTEVVKISKLIKAPMREVFAWCTDYSDLDPQIMGSGGSQTRRIIARDTRKIVFIDTYVDPAVKARKVEVSLRPPNKWRAKFSGGRWDGTGTYVLSETPEGTRLDIVFRMEKAIEGYTAQDLMRRANEIWDKYAAEMEKIK
jgi:hypothetical protein